MRWTLLALLSLSTVGCAMAPVHPSDADSVPIEHVQAWRLDRGEPITVVRDSGFYGAACRIQFLIEGSNVARIQTSEAYDFRLPPGDYTFETESYSFCGGNGSTYRARIEEDKGPYIYRITYSGQTIQIKPHFDAMRSDG